MFKNFEELRKRLEDEKYIANDAIIQTVSDAIRINSPILVDGPAGVGKTELAKTLARILECELIPISCYEGIDFSKVLYDINYSKQILYVNMLKDNIQTLLKGKDFKDAVNVLNSETNFYSKDFIIERPILHAMNPKNNKRNVLLIDEIDKSDAEFEYMLFEALADFSVTIPEYGTIKAPENLRPIVILTSNNVRELSESLKRRCMYLYVDYPSIENEAQIISLRTDMNYDFATKVAKSVYNIRQLDLKQKPSVAESITWAKTLLLNLEISDFNLENKNVIDRTLGALLKNKNDIQKAAKTNYVATA